MLLYDLKTVISQLIVINDNTYKALGLYIILVQTIVTLVCIASAPPLLPVLPLSFLWAGSQVLCKHPSADPGH